MNIYLVAFDLENGNHQDLNALLSKLGAIVPAHKYATFLSSELTSDEIHNAMSEHSDYYDQWTVTKLDECFSGFSNNTAQIREFMLQHQFL